LPAITHETHPPPVAHLAHKQRGVPDVVPDTAFNRRRAVNQIAPDLTDMRVRFSHLKAYGRSPKHGLRSRTHEMKQSAAMQFGKSVDAVIYGTRKVTYYPGKTRAGKKYAAFLEENPDAEILLKEHYDNVMGAVEAVQNDPTAREFLTGIHQETLLFDYNGLPCRATPDTRGNGFLRELKVTTDTSERFIWHAKKMHYPTQMWMQRIACEMNPRDGYAVPERLIITAVEDKPPHVVTVFEVMPSLQDKAARTLMFWSERLKAAEQSKFWAGYSTAIVPMEDDVEMPELVYGDEE